MNKICKNCNQVKDISSFYKKEKMKDGHLNKCIDCIKKIESKRFKDKMSNPDFVVKERYRGREKYERLGKNWNKSKDNKDRASKNYKNKYPEKIKATNATQHIIRKENHES